MSQHKRTSKKIKPNQRIFKLKATPFVHGDVLIAIWEDEKEIALFNAPPEIWFDENEMEKLLRYFINQGII